MKKMIFTLISIFSMSALAYHPISEGVYEGVDERTGKSCSISFEYDGDYAYSNEIEYRITVHTKGPRIKCDDNEGKVYDSCASGFETSNDEEHSLYILGQTQNSIAKIHFQDSDFDSTNDVFCVNLIKQ